MHKNRPSPHRKRVLRSVHLYRSKLLIGTALIAAILSSIALVGFQQRQQAAAGMAVSISPGVRYQHDNSGYFRPGQGRQFVIIQATFRNDTKAALQFAPVLQTYLTDASGMRYEMAPTSLKDPIDAGPIAPGAVRSGELSYNTELDADELTFHYQPSPDGPIVDIPLH